MVGLLNRRRLAVSDFVGDERRGVRLGRDGKRTFFEAWQAELERSFALDGETTSFRRLFRRQAERLARALAEGGGYEGLRWPG